MLDILIIGAGPVGLYAAKLARLHNLKGLVFETLDTIGGQLNALYPEKDIVDLPGFDSIKAKDYIDALLDHHEDALKIHLNEKVEHIESKEDYFIVKTNLNSYDSKTILITTGMGAFTPRKTGLKGEDNFKNIIYSIKNINEYKNKNITILGGGDSAVDWAIELKKIGSNVSIVHRREDFRAQSNNVEKMISLGVNVYKPYNVISLNGSNNTLTSITLQNQGEIIDLESDYLFVNYGLITSSTSLGIETKNNIYEVNTYMETKTKNIFAIGNVCHYEGKVKNITSGLGEAVTAITKIDQIINPNKNIPVHF